MPDEEMRLPAKGDVIRRLGGLVGGLPAPFTESPEPTWYVGQFVVTADRVDGEVVLSWGDGDDAPTASWPAEQARAIFMAGLAACDRLDGEVSS